MTEYSGIAFLKPAARAPAHGDGPLGGLRTVQLNSPTVRRHSSLRLNVLILVISPRRTKQNGTSNCLIVCP